MTTVIIRKKETIKPKKEEKKVKKEPDKKKKKPVISRFEKLKKIESEFKGVITYKVIGSKEGTQVISENFQAYDDAHKYIMNTNPSDTPIVYQIEKLFISIEKK